MLSLVLASIRQRSFLIHFERNEKKLSKCSSVPHCARVTIPVLMKSSSTARTAWIGARSVVVS